MGKKAEFRAGKGGFPGNLGAQVSQLALPRLFGAKNAARRGTFIPAGRFQVPMTCALERDRDRV